MFEDTFACANDLEKEYFYEATGHHEAANCHANIFSKRCP
jgi:hypothetical protein